MSLQNLLAIGSLLAFQAQRDDIQRLLTAAERNLTDAGVHAISALPSTVGLDSKTMVVLDGLRKQRHISDYNGAPISPTMVEECQKQANALLEHVRAWLAVAHPEFC